MTTGIAEFAPALATRRILVTGASGFLGSHLTRALLACGARVHALVRQPQATSLPVGVEGHAGDVTNIDSLRRAVNAAEPSCVFHLAAYGTTGTQPDADHMFRVNVEGTRNLWAALGARNCRLVQTGTCGEYGAIDGPIAESMACRPQSSYAATVHAAITLSQALAFEIGREVVVLRPFGPYGPGDRPERLVPYVVIRLLAGEPADVSDGYQLRDYSFVDDQVRALLLAATRPLPRVAPVYNIGSGGPIRVRALLEAIAAAVGAGAAGRLVFGARPYRRDDPHEMYADTSAATRELGYTPAVSLQEGLSRTVAWYRARRETRPVGA